MDRVTLWGFYQYDKTLFDDIVLPEGIEKENLVAEIMKNSGDLYPYHQVAEYLKRNITYWFARRLFDFGRIYEALRMEYSPIENYDRKENNTRDYENSGIDKASTTLGSTTTSTNIGNSRIMTLYIFFSVGIVAFIICRDFVLIIICSNISRSCSTS